MDSMAMMPPRRRRGRSPKLPKMTNSERGKYYRHKQKQYVAELESSLDALRKDAQDLALLLELRSELATKVSYQHSGNITACVLDFLASMREGVHVDTTVVASAAASPRQAISFSPQALSRPGDDEIESNPQQTTIFFELDNFALEGTDDAVIVVVKGIVHARFAASALEAILPRTRTSARVHAILRNKDVTYAGSYRLFFGPDGTMDSALIDTDYVHGLQQELGRLSDVLSLIYGPTAARDPNANTARNAPNEREVILTR